MRFNFISIVLLLSLSSCGEDGSENNLPPPTPQLFFPADKEECLYSPLSLEWTASMDPEGDPVSYTVEISETTGFESLRFSTNTTETTETFNLKRGTIYYWRVKATDNNSNSSDYSQNRSFFTQPQLSYNQFPYVPQLETPAYGSEVMGNKILLKWNCEDPDGDSLKYDLYVSNENIPNLFKENLEVNTYEVVLEPAKTYYWRIVAKDGKGAKSFGPIWKFIN